MNDDEVWLLEQGFRVEVEGESSKIFWAHLVQHNNPQDRAPKYGRGDSPEASIRSARRRYEVEQLGN